MIKSKSNKKYLIYGMGIPLVIVPSLAISCTGAKISSNSIEKGKQTKPKPNLQVKDLNFLTVKDALSKIDNKYIIDNFSILFEGDHTSKNWDENSILNIEKSISETQLKLSIEFAPNTIFDAQGNLISTSQKLEITINDSEVLPPTPTPPTPTPPTPTPPTPEKPQDPVLEELKKGGLLDSGLETDSYLLVIKYLNLNKYSKLSNINIAELNNTLKKHQQFSGLTLALISGSNEKDGVLKLQINGTYKGQQVPSSAIEITGFYNPNELLKISNRKLNAVIDKKKYFDALQTEVDIPNWTIEQYKQYLSVLILTLPNNTVFETIDLLKSDLFSLKFSFEINTKIVSLTLQWDVNKSFDGTNWVPVKDQSQSLTRQVIVKESLKIPTKQDALQYVLDNQIKVITDPTKVNQDISAKFPSYYYSKAKVGGSVFLRTLFVFEKEQQIKAKYFSNDEISFENINLDSIHPNDSLGTLEVNIELALNNDNQIKTTVKPFEISGFLNMNDFITQSKNDSNKFSGIIIDQNYGSWNNILKKVKTKYSTFESIPQDKVNTNISITAGIVNNRWIYNSEVTSSKLTSINGITFDLFGKKLNDAMDLTLDLFDNMFNLNVMTFDTKNQTSQTLQIQRMHDGAAVLTLSGMYFLQTTPSSSELFEIPCELSLTFTKTQFEAAK